jgi:hypothetical protein
MDMHQISIDCNRILKSTSQHMQHQNQTVGIWQGWSFLRPKTGMWPAQPRICAFVFVNLSPIMVHFALLQLFGLPRRFPQAPQIGGSYLPLWVGSIWLAASKPDVGPAHVHCCFTRMVRIPIPALVFWRFFFYKLSKFKICLNSFSYFEMFKLKNV